MVSWPKPTSRCPSCGCAIESRIDQLIGVCQKLSCRGPYLARQGQAAKEREAAEHQLLMNQLLPMIAGLFRHSWGSGESPPANIRITTVPHSPGMLSKPLKHRISEFESYLDSLLTQTDSILGDHAKTSATLSEYDRRIGQEIHSVSLPVVNGCTTCRGYCCRHGGDKAFLTSGFLAWQMMCDPTLTKDAIRSTYLRQLPEFSVEDSCVFHSQSGCSLPRNQRNDICNEFHCSEIRNAMQSTSVSPVEWVAISHDGSCPSRIGVMTLDGIRREYHVPLTGSEETPKAQP